MYLLAGGREESDWVKNLRADPTVTACGSATGT